MKNDIQSKVFITTTLPYANSTPHIGHMFEFVLADAIKKYLGAKNIPRYLNMGLDCHGTKIWQKAQESKMEPGEYIDQLIPQWTDFCSKFLVQYDSFYITADPIHHEKVKKVWERFLERGDIYKKEYEGTYCVGCEAFKLSKELVEGKCQDHPNLTLETIKEENYFFRLSKYKDHLTKWIHESPDFLTPASKTDELLNLIQDSGDISISRLRSKCPWGVDVPNDPDQVIYVWFDALLNYIFAAGYNPDDPQLPPLWENVIQICGPDNLRFQAVVFQAMLASEGIPQTDRLLVHGMVLDDQGRKMSKTVGNVIDPMEQIEKYGLDAVRYYTLAGLSTTHDSAWSEHELKVRFNSEICNDWGNFISRVLHLIDTKCGGQIGFTDYHIEPEVHQRVGKAYEEVDYLWSVFRIKEAIQKTNELIAFGNKYINDRKPWAEKEQDKINSILTNCYMILATGYKLYFPVFPHKSDKLKEAMDSKKKVILFDKIV
jgi:methionyl-tRNA synthetase